MSRGSLLAVGLCTYKRPELLRSCLDSLAAAAKPAGVPLRIVIADNDPAGSAAPGVEEFAARSPVPVDYAVETGRGIPFARNNVLRRALGLGATELAFIDDDERADPAWLVRLWDHYIESRADAVRGHVVTEYREDAPNWLIRGGFYQRANRRTGTVLGSASTNNVLFDLARIGGEWGFRFDESFGLRGGSDSDFFMRASRRGAVISWVAEALVYETLEPRRHALGYLLRRKFRTRNSRGHFAGMGPRPRAALLLRSSWKILSGIIALPFAWAFGVHAEVEALCRIAEGAGRFLGSIGIHRSWDEYHGD